MKTKQFFSFLLVFIFCGLPLFSSGKVGPPYAIIHCHVVPVTGPHIEDATIIIREGLIETLGPCGKIAVPEDAEIFDAKGLYAYPGLIDAHTKLFLETPRAQTQTQRTSSSTSRSEEKPAWQKTDFMAYDYLKPSESALKKYHKNGITTVLVAPQRGIFAGKSVLLNLNGTNRAPMVLQNPFALHINFTVNRGQYPSSLMGVTSLIRQSFMDANYYNKHKLKHSGSPNGLKRPEYNPFLENLVPFVVHKKPVIFNCANQEDIKRALRIISEFDLNGFISGANEAWRVSSFLKKAKAPLLVSLKFRPPFTSKYNLMGNEIKKKAEEEIYPANAGNLYKAGIRFSLTSHGLTNAGDILKNIRKIIKSGLPKEEALRSLTIVPAEILGLSHVLGTLEKGKIANIILASGEIFEEKSVIRQVFIDGISYEVTPPPKKPEPEKKIPGGE
jgi:hypothetical protein